MMWGNGYGMAWGWPAGLLILVTVAALVLLAIWAVRTFGGGADSGVQHGGAAVASGKGDRSHARQILDDRFARGELDETEYRERRRALEGEGE